MTQYIENFSTYKKEDFTRITSFLNHRQSILIRNDPMHQYINVLLITWQNQWIYFFDTIIVSLYIIWLLSWKTVSVMYLNSNCNKSNKTINICNSWKLSVWVNNVIVLFFICTSVCMHAWTYNYWFGHGRLFLGEHFLIVRRVSQRIH